MIFSSRQPAERTRARLRIDLAEIDASIIPRLSPRSAGCLRHSVKDYSSSDCDKVRGAGFELRTALEVRSELLSDLDLEFGPPELEGRTIDYRFRRVGQQPLLMELYSPIGEAIPLTDGSDPKNFNAGFSYSRNDFANYQVPALVKRLLTKIRKKNFARFTTDVIVVVDGYHNDLTELYSDSSRIEWATSMRAEYRDHAPGLPKHVHVVLKSFCDSTRKSLVIPFGRDDDEDTYVSRAIDAAWNPQRVIILG